MPINGHHSGPPLSLETLTDLELRQFETRRNSLTPSFIPSFPQNIIQIAVQSGACLALPLILAIHRQLIMTKRDSTPLNEAVWRCAGSPTHKQRATIIRKLKSLPELIVIIPARTLTAHYRVAKGSAWATRSEIGGAIRQG
jgi:hypothetical protein